MSLSQLLTDLAARDITFSLGTQPGRLKLNAPTGVLTPELLSEVTVHKPDLLALLAPSSAVMPAQSSCTSEYGDAEVAINGMTYRYQRRWDGQRFAPVDDLLALDTETDLVDLKQNIPALALASVSDGGAGNALVHPADLGRFILEHRELQYVCHNAAFDFWVIEQHLRENHEEEARQAWWRVAEENRLHDSMLLDALVRLARDDHYPEMRDLALVAKDYAGLVISKDDPYRLRYGEIIGRPWDQIDVGFFDYGMKDAIVTAAAYRQIRKQSQDLIAKFGTANADILPDAAERYGLLTEAIQVKKAIALAQITRNGMCVDLPSVRNAEARLRGELLAEVAAAQAIHAVYKTDSTGNLVLSGKSEAPAFDDKKLRGYLLTVKKRIEADLGTEIGIPQTKTGISRATEAWEEIAHLDPFLEHWTKAQGLSKLIQFYAQFDDQVDLTELADRLHLPAEQLAVALKQKLRPNGSTLIPAGELLRAAATRKRDFEKLGLDLEPVLSAIRGLAEANRTATLTIHPSYRVMVRSGRTSCSSPNIQQIPRSDIFRRVFLAPEGTFLAMADYAFIELRTLAATTLHRFGKSRMAEVIKAGIDPHAHTAAMMLGVSQEEFATWKNNETTVTETDGQGHTTPVQLRNKYDLARQSAKAVNFGVPGGLGVASLVAYARSTYGVDLTVEQAADMRQHLTGEIYPELDLYLADDAIATIARNLGASVADAKQVLGKTNLGCVYKTLAGNPTRTDGVAYNSAFVTRIWKALAWLNRNPQLQTALAERRASPELASTICYTAVATLTGRIRGRVRYSQARNSPFQGLAADGASLALFDLIKEGFTVTAFIHDEIHVLLPDEGGYVAESKVQRFQEIMQRRMEEVLVGGIPVECEAVVSDRWHKKAKLIVEDGRVYPWQPVDQT